MMKVQEGVCREVDITFTFQILTHVIFCSQRPISTVARKICRSEWKKDQEGLKLGDFTWYFGMSGWSLEEKRVGVAQA